MIKANGDRRVEEREDVFGGVGKLRLKHYFSQEDLKAPVRMCSEVFLPPGSATGEHVHDGEDEVYIIQKGSGVYTENGVETPVGVGDVMITGDGNSHAIRNDGDQEMVFTAIIVKY